MLIVTGKNKHVLNVTGKPMQLIIMALNSSNSFSLTMSVMTKIVRVSRPPPLSRLLTGTARVKTVVEL